MSQRSWLFLGAVAAVVLVSFVVARGFRERTDRDCPRPFAVTELSALVAFERGGWPAGMESPQPGNLRPLTDPDDSEACRRLRELLPDTLVVGSLAATSAAFYQVGEAYVVPVVPNLRPEEIAAVERGEFGAERYGFTYVVSPDFEVLAVIEE